MPCLLTLFYFLCRIPKSCAFLLLSLLHSCHTARSFLYPDYLKSWRRFPHREALVVCFPCLFRAPRTWCKSFLCLSFTAALSSSWPWKKADVSSLASSHTLFCQNAYNGLMDIPRFLPSIQPLLAANHICSFVRHTLWITKAILLIQSGCLLLYMHSRYCSLVHVSPYGFAEH